MSASLLPFLIAFPILVGTLLCFLGERLGSVAYRLGLACAGVVLLGSVLLIQQTSAITVGSNGASLIQPRIVFSPSWMNLAFPIDIQGHPIDWQLQLGADGFAAAMTFLAALVTMAVLVTASNQITHRLGLYAGVLLIAEGLAIGVFLSLDLLLFYVFFEAVLLPIILLINLWGDPKESLAASRKFLIYTLAGSIPMVVGLIGLMLQGASKDRPSTVLMTELSSQAAIAQLDPVIEAITPADDSEKKLTAAREKADAVASSQVVILAMLLLGLGIKMALIPVHTWLPTTYVATHPNTTAFIAAVIGKLGAFGMLRLVFPFIPVTFTVYAQLIIGALGAFAIVYGAVIALGQTDLRRLLAYSSLSHMGFVTVGLMAMNEEGLAGASLQMLNHGILTAAMFLLLGMIEARRGRIVLTENSRGLAAAYPLLGTLMVFFTLAAAGLPGLNSFVGEILAMTGMSRVSLPITALAVLGTVFGAWYSLRVLQYIMFGSDGSSSERVSRKDDLGFADLVALVPLVALAIFIGVLPSQATSLMKPDVDLLASKLETATQRLHPDIDSSMLVSNSK